MNKTTNRRTALQSVAITACLFFLGGCAGINGRFTCDAKSKDACTPLDRVNQMADQGAFDRPEGPGAGSSNVDTTLNPSAGASGGTGVPPVRTGESVQPIWIAPYEDTGGVYHAGAYVYAVVKPSRWAGGDPVQSAPGHRR